MIVGGDASTSTYRLYLSLLVTISWNYPSAAMVGILLSKAASRSVSVAWLLVIILR